MGSVGFDPVALQHTSGPGSVQSPHRRPCLGFVFRFGGPFRGRPLFEGLPRALACGGGLVPPEAFGWGLWRLGGPCVGGGDLRLPFLFLLEWACWVLVMSITASFRVFGLVGQ